MDRPITTLFMLMSVDGKISTGATDELDVDRDFPQIAGLREGLHQYYEIEQTKKKKKASGISAPDLNSLFWLRPTGIIRLSA